MKVLHISLFAALWAISLALPAQNSQQKRDAFISALMKRMTPEEKIGQLNLVTAGYTPTGIGVSTDVEQKITKGQVGGLFGAWGVSRIRSIQELAVTQSRLKIPLIFGLDVIHGHRTTFPIPLGLAASWDMALIERTARVAAIEASADGLNWTFSPMVDIARDPRWGRIAEGSGEDPYLGSQIARAMVRGYQGSDLSLNNTLMACVKHYALYGAAEAGRDYNTVDMSRPTMYNYYLPPYKAAVEEGAGSVMTSFNVVDGVPATGNRWLMTEVLRKQWGFKGFVVTDYTAINEMSAHGLGDLQAVSALALRAGVDMDMVGEGFLSTLKQSLAEGKITQQEIDDACRRVLEAKYALGLFDDPFRYMDPAREASDILTPAHRQAAREAAARSFVLLKNDQQTLPLRRDARIALIGPLADNQRDMVGTWVIGGDWQRAVSVRQGMSQVAPQLRYAKGANITDDTAFIRRINFFDQPRVVLDSRSPQEMIVEALEAARDAEVIVAALGESESMSGESSSRTDIGIPEAQRTLLRALVATGKPVVLLLFNGRPLTLSWEAAHCAAILDVWAPGDEAGNAIADVLFGAVNPSGKLPASFPRSVGQIPLYYNHLPTGRPYTGGPAKFRTNYLDSPNEPLFPFGHGLSYTRFAYGPLRLSKTQLKGNEILTASLTLTNSGPYDGEEVVQLYLSDPVASISRSVMELKGFQKVMLKAGESREVSFQISTEALKFYNSELRYDWEPGEFLIHVGGSSAQVQSAKLSWAK